MTLGKDAVTPDAPFTPPIWALYVNWLFFASLTTSILAALAAVTCLQWVAEYDADFKGGSTAKQRALRRHYRYRAVQVWKIDQMIAILPIILYVSVVLFFK